MTDTGMSAEMREAIKDSIKKEQESYDFYSDAASKVKTDELRELFTELAEEELGHRTFLEKVLEEEAFSSPIHAQKTDFRLAEEAIEEKPELSTEMPFDDAIALAIKREEEAMTLYQNLANQITDNKEMYDMFINLRNMEQAHKTRLESIYMNVAYSEVW
ncbi:MAG: ferritin family protein [Eubacteriales bacterium]|nr:ferritin family protein [Eubacteriales bacterium]MDD4541611.1 ferritin family protein [Eubacteriales bacterium]